MHNDVNQKVEAAAVVEIDAIELETIASALCVRTGLKAGIQPCL